MDKGIESYVHLEGKAEWVDARATEGKREDVGGQNRARIWGTLEGTAIARATEVFGVPDRCIIESDFNLGGEQAEADPLLEDAFIESATYKSISSRGPKCFMIGRTGSGKSAFIRHLGEEHPTHVIRVDPEDLSLPYILDLQVVQRLSGLGVHLDPFFIALWKHVLIVEIFKHRYRIDSPAAKQTFLTTLREKISRDRSKQVALDYVDEFGENFWCETDERVKEITQVFERSVTVDAGAGLQLPGLANVGGGGEVTTTQSQEVRSERIVNYQRIVNDTQLPRLNKMIDVLDEDVLDSHHLFTFVVIDDLDRDWADEKLQNDLIRCLFRAVLDLQRVRNLKVIVALRTNIFEHLNFGSRTGGQEEKFRSLALHVRWNKTDLLALCNARAKAAASRVHWSRVTRLADLLPEPSAAGTDAFAFCLERTLMRPRDMIAFLNEALAVGYGKERLSWDDLREAEGPYSRNRLLALRDEWKPTFPGIESVFQKFEGCPSVMTRDEFQVRLDEAAMLTADRGFAGVMWMTDLTEPLWSSSGADDWASEYQPLTKLLYDIGFVGIQRESGSRMHYSTSVVGYADNRTYLGPTARFAVHRAFWQALDIGEPASEADTF